MASSIEEEAEEPLAQANSPRVRRLPRSGRGACNATRGVELLLLGVRSTDPAIDGITCTVLLMGAGIAGYIPARRAPRVDRPSSNAPADAEKTE